VSDRDHFRALAESWSYFGPPLRPSPADTAALQRAIAPDVARALVLGVTPEIRTCTWPPRSTVLSLDHSLGMIRALWPGDRAAIAGDWTALPLRDGSIDVVAGDGSCSVLPSKSRLEQLTQEVARVLRARGRFVTRVFVRAEPAESLATIEQDLVGGRIGSVHAFKLRMLASLHGVDCVRLGDVWDAWRKMRGPPADVGIPRGWSSEEVSTLEGYRGLDARYFFPTLAEFRGLVARDFAELECSCGAYELADRCPTLVLVRR